MLPGTLAEGLPLLRRVNTGEPNLVLYVVGQV